MSQISTNYKNTIELLTISNSFSLSNLNNNNTNKEMQKEKERKNYEYLDENHLNLLYFEEFTTDEALEKLTFGKFHIRFQIFYFFFSLIF